MSFLACIVVSYSSDHLDHPLMVIVIGYIWQIVAIFDSFNIPNGRTNLAEGREGTRVCIFILDCFADCVFHNGIKKTFPH